MKTLINQIIKEHRFVMFYITGGKIYWLIKHYKYLNRREMLQHKVKLGPCGKELKLKEGFHYLTVEL